MVREPVAARLKVAAQLRLRTIVCDVVDKRKKKKNTNKAIVRRTAKRKNWKEFGGKYGITAI